MTITADTASERAYLPKTELIRNQLLLADAGYMNFNFSVNYLSMADHFIVRGGKNLNPVIIEARNGQGDLITQTRGYETQEIDRKTNARVLDLKIKRGQDEFRLVRRWFMKEKRFLYLGHRQFSSNDVVSRGRSLMIYRCRWRRLSYCLRAENRYKLATFCNGQQAIMEGLVWASLHGLDHPQVHRHAKYAVRFGVQSREKKNVDVWLLPILEAYIRKHGQEATARLEWAIAYIYQRTHKNHDKEKSRK